MLGSSTLHEQLYNMLCCSARGIGYRVSRSSGVTRALLAVPFEPRLGPRLDLVQGHFSCSTSLLLFLFPEKLYRLCWTLRNNKEKRVDLDAGEMVQGMEDYEEEPGEITFTMKC